jgi:hypothetical protein
MAASQEGSDSSPSLPASWLRLDPGEPWEGPGRRELDAPSNCSRVRSEQVSTERELPFGALRCPVRASQNTRSDIPPMTAIGIALMCRSVTLTYGKGDSPCRCDDGWPPTGPVVSAARVEGCSHPEQFSQH